MKINLLLSTVVLVGSFIAGFQNYESPPEEVEDGSFYNLRYCEILMAEIESPSRITAEVFNTIACNECPQELWEALDFRAITKEYGVTLAVPNGPRYFIMDSIISTRTLEPCTDNFGGIDMTSLATLNLSTRQALRRKPYLAAEVDRSTIYEFRAGREVYVLNSPDDKCYIMQSYSQQVYDTLQLEDLKNLGSILELPNGWSFEVVQLEEAFHLEAPNDKAMVIQDELQNSYQYLHEGCLN